MQELEARLSVLEQQFSAAVCTSKAPHGDMTFQRGPNLYHCRCGQTYEKDGHGGLREVVDGA